MVAALEPENARAWRIFNAIYTRLLYDAEMVGVVFERLTRGLDDDDFEDVLYRLRLIYDIWAPPKAED
jgi:hypothetical protein